MTNIQVCAMYQFVRFADYADFRAPLYQQLNSLGLRGTILIADEGINGTIAGKP